MASGYSYSGGRSRCHPYWQEFTKCYAKADHPSECIPQKEDYVECLHHTQEKARAKAIRTQYLKKQEREAREGKKEADVKATSSPIGLGLIDQSKPATKEPAAGNSPSGEAQRG